jgi:hypothetical protein
MSETSASTSDPQQPAAGDEAAGDEAARAPEPSDTGEKPKEPQQTLLEQMGGVAGLVYSAVPVVVFVVVNAVTGLMPAIWTAVATAVVIGIVRLVRREPLQPAISGVLVVAVCSYIAYRSGQAKGFFLLGIWTSLLYGGVFLLSIVLRWPLVGAAWSLLNSQGFAWRRNRRAMLGYDLATLTWVVVFGAKFVVQHWLYDTNQTGWLAFARIAMSYPLTVLALLVTVWAIRRARQAGEVSPTASSASPVSE